MLAIKAAGYSSIVVTINLGPADIKKTGTDLILPIAVAILGQLLDRFLKRLREQPFFGAGELSLNGKISSVRGMAAYAMLAKEAR